MPCAEPIQRFFFREINTGGERICKPYRASTLINCNVLTSAESSRTSKMNEADLRYIRGVASAGGGMKVLQKLFTPKFEVWISAKFISSFAAEHVMKTPLPAFVR